MRTGEKQTLFEYSAIVDRPPLVWPEGKRLAFFLVPNIEHIELRGSDARANNHDNARLDYGNRVGIWRFIEVMDRDGVRGTVSLNSSVTRHYPRMNDRSRPKRSWR